MVIVNIPRGPSGGASKYFIIPVEIQ